MTPHNPEFFLPQNRVSISFPCLLHAAISKNVGATYTKPLLENPVAMIWLLKGFAKVFIGENYMIRRSGKSGNLDDVLSNNSPRSTTSTPGPRRAIRNIEVQQSIKA